MSASADDIDVTVGDTPDDGSGATSGRKSAVVTDRKSQRAWSGEGATESEATTEAVRRFIGDRRAREYVP